MSALSTDSVPRGGVFVGVRSAGLSHAWLRPKQDSLWGPHAVSPERIGECLEDYIDTYNENPRSLVWTKPADKILKKVERARQALAAAAI